MHVQDVVQVIEKILETKSKTIKGEVFNVATGKPTAVNAIARLIIRIISGKRKKKVKVIYKPPREGGTLHKELQFINKQNRKELGLNLHGI